MGNGRAPSPQSDRVLNPPRPGGFTRAEKLLVTKARRTTVMPRTLLFLGVFGILFAPCEAADTRGKARNAVAATKPKPLSMKKTRSCANAKCPTPIPKGQDVLWEPRSLWKRVTGIARKFECDICHWIYCEECCPIKYVLTDGFLTQHCVICKPPRKIAQRTKVDSVLSLFPSINRGRDLPQVTIHERSDPDDPDVLLR